MKRILSSLGILAYAGTTAFAQLSNGSTAPDWIPTLVDNTNVTWNLYTTLAAGKTVFVEVGATWSQASWNYHTTGPLNQLWTTQGPSGTGMCEIFFIESDGSTGNADLTGQTTASAGDWVSTTNYHVIDIPPASAFTWNAQYAIAFYPTIYMICPNRQIYQVGQLNYAQLVTWMNTCPYALDALPTGAANLFCNTTYSPECSLKNNNASSALTSCTITYQIDAGMPQTYNWSGNLVAGMSTTVTLAMQTGTLGNHTLMVATSAPNGGNDQNTNNDVGVYGFEIVTTTATMTPYAQLFAATGFPYLDWGLENPDGATTWVHSTAGGGSVKLDCYNYAAIGAEDAFTLPPLDLSPANVATLQFDVAYRTYNALYDDEKLEVRVSTDCGATWTNVWSKRGDTLASAPPDTSAFVPTVGQWRMETINLTPFAGNNRVFIQFVATNGFGNNIYVDNISVSNPTDVLGDAIVSDYRLFPNPADAGANMTFALATRTSVTVRIYDMVGALVSCESRGMMDAGEQTIYFDTEQFGNGMYIVEVATGEQRIRSHLNVSH